MGVIIVTLKNNLSNFLKFLFACGSLMSLQHSLLWQKTRSKHNETEIKNNGIVHTLESCTNLNESARIKQISMN